MRRLLTALSILAAAALVSACEKKFDPDAPLVPMGDFRLGYNVVVANEPQQGAFSRDVPDEVWEKSLTDAIQRELGRYDGTGLYHIGVKVEAYVAAMPGVPVVYSPKSILILAVNVWDNRTQQKLTAEPYRLTVFEDTTAPSAIFGSGYARTMDDQVAGLSENAAAQLHKFLLENIAWFERPPVEGEPVPFPPEPADQITQDQAETAIERASPAPSN